MTKIDLRSAHVLITGGSEGIGRGLAQRYLDAGTKVLITGRNPQKLEQARKALPGLQTLVNDIGKPEDRETLAQHVRSNLPHLNVLINNAGIQRRVPLAADTASWAERQAEIDILLSGPVHLNHLLVPLLLQNQPALVINVTSGGAFIPQVFAPVYSACKAAVHSYTVVLRHALQGTQVRVVELAPPRVQTSLGNPAAAPGVPLEDYCNDVFPRLHNGEEDVVGYGLTNTPEFKEMVNAVEPFFAASTLRFPVKTYSS
jgi:uncharacterized oxidoreductase